MPVVHIVLFKLKSSLDEAGVSDFCNDMLSLREKCIHPKTLRPYIVGSSGGVDNSPEGAQGGFTHGFVVEFTTKEDRDYYVFKDPAHQSFVKKNSDKFKDVRVVDYEMGVYQ